MGSGIEIGLVCGDEVIVRLAAELLASSHYASLPQLHFESRSGELTVSGAVGSFYERQLAVNYCKNLPGVVAVIDLIDVCSP